MPGTICDRHDIAIIEDDVYGPMLSRRPPPIATMRPDRTYYIASLSKAIAPGLRVGYLLSPPGKVAPLAEAIQATSWMPAPQSVLIGSKWIEDGTAEAILEAQLGELEERHDLARRVLSTAQFNGDPRCMFIWLDVPEPWRLDDFVAIILRRGVKVMPATAFVAGRAATEHAVRINLACASSRQELTTALEVVANTLRERPRALFNAV